MYVTNEAIHFDKIPQTVGTKLSLGGIFGRSGNLAQDKIPNVKSSELYPLIVVFSHFLLILRHSDGSFFSYFVYTI